MWQVDDGGKCSGSGGDLWPSSGTGVVTTIAPHLDHNLPPLCHYTALITLLSSLTLHITTFYQAAIDLQIEFSHLYRGFNHRIVIDTYHL